MTTPIPKFSGRDGELVSRLVDLCRDEPNEQWAKDNLSMLGMAAAIDLVPLTDAESDGLAERLRSHLMNYVALGFREEVLVRALRDELDETHRQFADTTTIEAKKAERRTFFERLRDNPDKFVGRGLGDTAQAVVEAAERLLRSELNQPADADESANRWARAAAWERRRNTWLPDEALREWVDASFRRSAGG